MWPLAVFVTSFFLLFCSLTEGTVLAQHETVDVQRGEEKCLFRYGEINIQLPVQPIEKQGDHLTDIQSLVPLFDLHVEMQQDKIVIYKGKQLMVTRVGKRGAFLNGRFLLLHTAPENRNGHILLPILQTLNLLQIPHHSENGQVVIDVSLPLIHDVRKAVVLANGKPSIGYLGILGENRMVVALRPLVQGKPHGYGTLYELRKEKTWKANKLWQISDTSADVYLEWMPNGTVFENIAVDARPEFLFVETCLCAGRYHYATLFTLTELGIQSLWHSSSSFSHVEKNGDRFELISFRKENIPERNSAFLPYWEVHEVWNGQSFVTVKEEYHDPMKPKQ